MNVYRIIFTFILLSPYFVFYRLNNTTTPFWLDMIVAAAAFGIGYAVFPDKKRNNKGKNQKNDSLIDQ